MSFAMRSGHPVNVYLFTTAEKLRESNLVTTHAPPGSSRYMCIVHLD